ncbi:MAG: MFS transporter [Acidobacteriota bacterium]|nr:MFS transporter [Acidobacteriota bacterium]
MHYALLLAGLGTALLGPILPVLAHDWQLKDAQSGLLMMAKFCGAFLGGVTVQRRLRRSLCLGLGAAAVGFGGFAMAPGLAAGCATLLVGGYGLGQIIASTNILAGRRFLAHRAASLALLNFSFSLGAMLSALLSAWLLPYFALRPLLLGFAALLLAGLAALLLQQRNTAEELEIAVPVSAEEPHLRHQLYLYFAALLVLYGGLETCMSGWLTTYALRYGDRSLALSEYTTLLLWGMLTVGRVLASGVLRYVSEQRVQRVSLGLAALFTAALAVAHGAWPIAAIAMALGLSLAAFFPATFSLLMAEHPSARQAGVVLAVSGLGAAALPWLMGVISTSSGSLQRALVLPWAAAVALLGLSWGYHGRGQALR